MNENTKTKKGFGGFLEFIKNAFFSFSDKFNYSLKERNYYYLSFALPIVILYITFACLGMFPFGTKTILTLDMDGQYIYFFEQLRDVYTGEASIFYTFERCLGGEFLGYFTYYLASPISVLVVLFPRKMITEAIMAMLVLKSGLSGLTFSVFLSKTRKKNPVGFTIFSVMYALCSFGTLYQFNTMWMDAMIWLPLIALGIEGMVTTGKFKLFVISLSLAVCSNYYIGYMLCIFVFFYFLFALFSRSNEETNLLNERFHVFKSFVRIAAYSFLALMLSAAIIFSAYYALKFGKTDYQDSPMDLTLRFDVLELISKLFLGSFDTVRPEGTPEIYAGTLTLMMLPVFYMSKRVKTREKVFFTIFCLVFILSFSVNTIDLIWHGFQSPNWLNYRYSFMFSFIMLLMAYRGYEEYDEISTGFMGKTAAFLMVLLAIIQRTVTLVRYEWIDGKRVEVETTPGYGMIWLSFLFILLYLLIFCIRKRSKFIKTSTVLLTVVVCIEAFANSTINWVGEINDGGWASRGNYRQFADKIEPATDAIYAKDPGFYRMEHTVFRKSNDNMLANIKGISEFSSTFNASSVVFMKRLGFFSSSPTVKYFSGNALTDSLLGIKYVIGSNTDDTNGELPGLNSVSSLYSFYTTEDGYVIYENPYALPIAYKVNSAIKDFKFNEDEKSVFTSINSLVAGMLGTDSSSILETCPYTTEKGALKSIIKDDEGGISYKKSDSDSSSYFYFRVTPQRDGNVYMYLPSPYTTKASVSVNGKTVIDNLYENENNRIIDLGYYKAGSYLRVELQFSHYRLYIWDTQNYFVQVNDEELLKMTDSFKASGLQVEEHSDTKISGTVSSNEAGTVFTTIPYDENWNVYVDGERVEIMKLADATLGFDISEGEHTVELKYVHKPFWLGAVISIIGIAIFVVLCILEKHSKRTLSCVSVNETLTKPICDDEATDLAKTQTEKADVDLTDCSAEEIEKKKPDSTNEDITSEENNDIPS